MLVDCTPLVGNFFEGYVELSSDLNVPVKYVPLFADDPSEEWFFSYFQQELTRRFQLSDFKIRNVDRCGLPAKKQLIIVYIYIYIYTWVSTYILCLYMLYHKRVSWDHVEKQYLNESELELNPLINSNSLLIAFEGWRKTHRKSIWMPNRTHQCSNAVAGARPVYKFNRCCISSKISHLNKVHAMWYLFLLGPMSCIATGPPMAHWSLNLDCFFSPSCLRWMERSAPLRFLRQRWRSGGAGMNGGCLSKTSRTDTQLSRSWKRIPPRHHRKTKPLGSLLQPPKNAASKLTILGVSWAKLMPLATPRSKRWGCWTPGSLPTRSPVTFPLWWCLMLAHTSGIRQASQFHGKTTFVTVSPVGLSFWTLTFEQNNYAYTHQ